MTKRTNTKRALFTSIISMLLCVSMLIGSTFAWFTDNATTNVNSIESGTLNVGLQMLVDGNWEDAEGKTLGFVDDEGKLIQNILWEPGCSYLLQPFKIVNKGNLALKFDVVVSGIEGDVALAEAIEYGLLLGDVNSLSFVSYGDLNNFNGLFDAIESANLNILKPAEELDTLNDGITFRMKKDAGNEYQGMTISGISITVRATQATEEEDSYSDQYDASATYDEIVNVTNQTALNNAVGSATGAVTLVLGEGTYTLPNLNNKEVTIAGTKNTIIDATENTDSQNAKITFDGVTVVFDNDGYEGFQHSEKVVYTDCTIKGTQFLYSATMFTDCIFEKYDNATEYNVWTYGVDATFTNCTFNTTGKAILVYNEGEQHATVIATNCDFNGDGTFNDKAAIEVGSSPYSADTTYEIIINECTEAGFNLNPKGIPTNSKLWGNKNSMDKDHLNVVIDGVDVY